MSKIVHVSETLATGVLSVIVTLIHEQVQQGHEVVLIGSPMRSDTPPDWRTRLPAGVQVLEFSMPQEIGPADLRCAWQLRQLLRNMRPDAVHLHSSKAGAIGRLAHLGLPGNVVYQPHGFSFLRSDVSRLKQGVFGLIEAVLGVLPARIVACSQGEADAASAYLGWRRIHVVPNGITLQGLPLAAQGRTARGARPVVGMCGRISPQKAPQFFAEVARLLQAECEFRWIGGGDYADGEAALHSAGVHVLGWRTREQVLADLQGLDFYIQTSAWEGMPISVMEAMACGLPTVVTDIPGNRDLIAPVSAASVVGTPQAMAHRLRELIGHPDQARALGQALQREVLDKYAAAAMSRAYEQVYGLNAA
jgi:glycosyltransferase involved in cell wall biosynthesis